MNVRGVKDLIFCSWNVDEVTNLVKRGRVLAHLKSLTSDIIVLQET